MIAHCKSTLNVTTLLERHTAARDVFNAAWAASPIDGAPEHIAERLTNVHDHLNQAAPATMSEWFAKWRAMARFDAALGDRGDTHPAIIPQMLDELTGINGRWCEP
jgi:hypothetical protein